MHGSPGASAWAGYQAARRRRRRQLAWVSVIGFGATVAALLAWGPWLAAGVVLVFYAVAVPVARTDPERWLRGAAGEQATARLLDGLPRRRWNVRHDLALPGSQANVDHVIIGRTGVWVIDTKATRGQVRARWRSVYLGNRRLDPGPTEWEAQVLSDRLGVPVRPVIAIQGDMASRRARAGGILVMPADQVVRRLRRGRRRLSRSAIRELTVRVDELFTPAAAGRRG